MATKKGPGPTEPLDPKVVKKLLDLLSTDNGFRRLFKKDAHAALVKAGWKPSPGVAAQASTAPVAALSGAGCMQLSGSDRIAPKQKIMRDRARLEAELHAVQHFTTKSGFVA